MEQLDELCALDHADGFILGPCDLSGSIGCLGDIKNERNMALIRQTIATLKKHGKCAGISLGSTEEEEQRFWIDLGLQFVSAGTDYDYLCRNARQNALQMRRLMGKA